MFRLKLFQNVIGHDIQSPVPSNVHSLKIHGEKLSFHFENTLLVWINNQIRKKGCLKRGPFSITDIGHCVSQNSLLSEKVLQIYTYFLKSNAESVYCNQELIIEEIYQSTKLITKLRLNDEFDCKIHLGSAPASIANLKIEPIYRNTLHWNDSKYHRSAIIISSFYYDEVKSGGLG